MSTEAASLDAEPAPASATSRERSATTGWADTAIALLLATGYVALLLSTVTDLGYARDEGFYFSAARHYERWFELLLSDPEQALTRASIDHHWTANHEHPALIKSLFALSDHLLFDRWRAFTEEGTAYRFPAMLLSGVGVGTVFLWGSAVYGRLAGVVAALLLAMMPRVFYHSHLDCFDMPVLTMWLVTTYAYWRSVTSRSLAWALVAGLLYGLLLDTKHNGWLLPPALVLHFVLTRGRGLGREVLRGRVRVPLGLVCMATLGPLVFYAGWPWIWHDTASRLVAYVKFHTQHAYYNMEFLGQTYWRPPMPRLYAWVMTLGTVPAVTLALFGVGAWRAARDAFAGRARVWWKDRRGRGDRSATWQRWPGRLDLLESALSPSGKRASSTRALWALCILTSYGPWLSSGTPIFGGTKHWITAYPFLCLFAGLGFAHLVERLRSAAAQLTAEGAVRRALLGWRALDASIALAVLVGPTVMTLHSHPWGLTAYTPLVGGAPGAATLGLNRGFWGYTTGAVTDFLNTAPARSGVYLHDTAMESWRMLQTDGRVRADLRGTLTPHDSKLGLYHHEQHMSRVEHQLWLLYGSTRPAAVGTYDGVPVVWVYRRDR